VVVDWRASSREIAARQPGTALINLASVEQHGPHLPVGTDYLIGQAIAAEVARRLDAYLLPSLPVGTCQEHLGGAGTVWIGPETLFSLVCDLCLSLGRQGFRRIAFLLSHGGLWMVKPAVREVNLNHPGLTVIWTHTYDHLRTSAPILESAGMDLHAGESETSLLLHLHPDLVRMDLAVDHQPGVGREYLDYLPCLAVCPDGVWGQPTLASADKGRRLFEAMVAGLVEYCRATFEMVEKTKGE